MSTVNDFDPDAGICTQTTAVCCYNRQVYDWRDSGIEHLGKSDHGSVPVNLKPGTNIMDEKFKISAKNNNHMKQSICGEIRRGSELYFYNISLELSVL